MHLRRCNALDPVGLSYLEASCRLCTYVWDRSLRQCIRKSGQSASEMAEKQKVMVSHTGIFQPLNSLIPCVYFRTSSPSLKLKSESYTCVA